jgi:nicotinate-nucleotide--dimethylbenzimidazole phosphoribosyltransferase
MIVTDFILPVIPALDTALAAQLRAKIDGKAKPPGSLGRIEDLAVRLGLIQNRLDPRIDRALALVFAADHGLTEEGVSAFPASVTAAMVQLFLSGRATVNAFAQAADVDVRVVDAGVAADLADHPGLIAAKIRHGSRNAAREPALTADEVARALARGFALAEHATAEGFDAIALGEMGIGNTATSALLMHRLLPAALEDCVGQGAGHDAAGMARKHAALARAAARSAATEPRGVLREFGGLEIAMMAGAAIGGAAARRVVLVDGFISSTALLVAARLQPAVLDYAVFAHRSAEKGHAMLLAGLGAEPIFDLGLRLGEGTGAVLAVPVLRAAARLLTDVADLAAVIGPP